MPAATAMHDTAINTIRCLAIDMVEAAKSGHPGAPMGQAALAYRLWTKFLRYSPSDPEWPNRDRFVLSCGHASALLYALLHLAGYELSLDDLRRFRQFGARTAGHPELGLAPGIETTTGPLGQGLANAVGMAIAERMLGATFNRDGYPLIDHRVWVLASDGDVMEGITSEASSLAGHHRLGKLNVLYDDNRISIDGPTDLTFSEDVGKRYESYGWHVQRIEDGNDLDAVDAALEAARAETDRPSLVVVRTHIGFGSPNKQDSAASHGAPLGEEEVRLTKEALGWPLEPTFHVPEEAYEAFRESRERGDSEANEWRKAFESYAGTHPEEGARFRGWASGQLTSGWDESLPDFLPEDGPMATRSASGKVLNAISGAVTRLTGGSADLTGSNNTYLKQQPDFTPETPGGRNLFFGVREHAMGAICNGMALSRMLRPYCGTFLIFSDYMRPAIRLAALMELPVVYVFTHDSIFLGEDGPTHQPISQLASLRSIPNLTVIRPADANEVAAAWKVALERTDGPTALSLTRQKLPVLQETLEKARDGVARGAYCLTDAGEDADAVLLATGSEVALALEARKVLASDGIVARVVSFPSWERFEVQDEDYRSSVLPRGLPKLAIEAGGPTGWHRWVGDSGDVLAIERFGASAPASALTEPFGLTAENVASRLRRLLA